MIFQCNSLYEVLHALIGILRRHLEVNDGRDLNPNVVEDEAIYENVSVLNVTESLDLSKADTDSMLPGSSICCREEMDQGTRGRKLYRRKLCKKSSFD